MDTCIYIYIYTDRYSVLAGFGKYSGSSRSLSSAAVRCKHRGPFTRFANMILLLFVVTICVRIVFFFLLLLSLPLPLLLLFATIGRDSLQYYWYCCYNSIIMIAAIALLPVIMRISVNAYCVFFLFVPALRACGGATFLKPCAVPVKPLSGCFYKLGLLICGCPYDKSPTIWGL